MLASDGSTTRNQNIARIRTEYSFLNTEEVVGVNSPMNHGFNLTDVTSGTDEQFFESIKLINPLQLYNLLMEQQNGRSNPCITDPDYLYLVGMYYLTYLVAMYYLNLVGMYYLCFVGMYYLYSIRQKKICS